MIDVASFTDAWIETGTMAEVMPKKKSHLLQMRGLKHLGLDWKHHRHKSHLLQMRGLKLQLFFNLKHLSNVASFTDAWIETIGANKRQKRASRIFYRCVD